MSALDYILGTMVVIANNAMPVMTPIVMLQPTSTQTLFGSDELSFKLPEELVEVDICQYDQIDASAGSGASKSSGLIVPGTNAFRESVLLMPRLKP